MASAPVQRAPCPGHRCLCSVGSEGVGERVWICKVDILNQSSYAAPEATKQVAC